MDADRRRVGPALSDGYSGTPLPRKLGIREGSTYAVVGDPGHLDDLLTPLPSGARRVESAHGADVVLLKRGLEQIQQQFGPLGFSFPKKG